MHSFIVIKNGYPLYIGGQAHIQGRGVGGSNPYQKLIVV